MSEPSRQLRAAACNLEGHDAVAGVAVHAPDDGETDGWALDISVYGDGGVPAAVLARLAEHDLSMRYCRNQGGHYALLATRESAHSGPKPL